MVCLQHTGLLPNDRFSLFNLPSSSYTPFFSNGSTNKTSANKGVATLVPTSYLNYYTISVLPLPKELAGRAIALKFTGLHDHYSFTHINVYLSPGSKHTQRSAQLNLLRKHVPLDEFVFLTGDFNFVEDKYKDSASESSYYDTPLNFRSSWSTFLNYYNLKEVRQDTHTYINPANNSSSRLDRFYVSYTEAAWASLNPFCCISAIPHSILSSSGAKGSDHLPVSLNFPPPSARPNGTSKRLPVWTTEHPSFLSFFEHHWYSRAHRLSHRDGFTLLDIFKSCLYCASDDVRHEVKGNVIKYHNKISKLVSIIKAIRFHNSGLPPSKLDCLPLSSSPPSSSPSASSFPSSYSSPPSPSTSPPSSHGHEGSPSSSSSSSPSSPPSPSLPSSSSACSYARHLHNDTTTQPQHNVSHHSTSRPNSTHHNTLHHNTTQRDTAQRDTTLRSAAHLRAEAFFRAHPSLSSLDLDSLLREADSILSEGEFALKPRSGARLIRSGRSRAPNAIKKLKLLLPSTRSRLHALRATMESPLTTDPDEMARLAASSWSPIWSERPLEEESISPESYFGDFHKNIPPDLIPVIPVLCVIKDIIAHSGSSSPGPDGIPFNAYRVTIDHAAPVFKLVLDSLCRGELPPAGYNFGLLYLLPKKGTLLPSDTRPISVTNADNRILMFAVVQAVTPALCATLHTAQKGFVWGRTFEDHIRWLNERFYSVAESKGVDVGNFFVLFMDTAKAFDSIDHAFIHEAVRRSGLPSWFSNIVRGILHGCKVRPSFPGAAPLWIDIRRGVKQGCPLSPLLFIICYDILLHRLSALPDVRPAACADDIALSTVSLPSLWPALRLVDTFRLASGLGVNTEKTNIISAKAFDFASHLPDSPWAEIKTPQSARYLGIIFGRNVTTSDVFKAPLDKLVARATSYISTFKTLSHAKRVLAFNVFIATKLSYHTRFFHLPYTTRRLDGAQGIVEAWASRLIIRFGSAYKYVFLISPPSLVGPGPPLRDAWATSMAALACQTDLSLWDGDTVAGWPGGPENPSSMRISRHARSAAHDYVASVLADTDPLPFVASDHIKEDGPSQRKCLYNFFINDPLGWKGILDGEVANKIRNWGLSHPASWVPILHHNYSLIPKNFPPHFRTFHFEVLANALPTRRRTLFLKFPDPTARGAAPRDPCFLCGRGEDSTHHLFGGECEVTHKARGLLSDGVAFFARRFALGRGHHDTTTPPNNQIAPVHPTTNNSSSLTNITTFT